MPLPPAAKTLCDLYNFAFPSHSPIPAFVTSDINFSSSATKRKIDPTFQGERVRLSWIPTNEDPLTKRNDGGWAHLMLISVIIASKQLVRLVEALESGGK